MDLLKRIANYFKTEYQGDDKTAPEFRVNIDDLREIANMHAEKCKVEAELRKKHIKVNTGLFDKNGQEIKIGDRTRLTLDNGELREFDVCFKTVTRTVKNHPAFVDGYSKVAITGIVFEWNDYNLFPCVDENGISDVSRMEIIH